MRMQNYSLLLVAASFWLSIIHSVALHEEIRYVLIGTGADHRALMPSSGRFVTPLPICCYFADISAQKSQKTTRFHSQLPHTLMWVVQKVQFQHPRRSSCVLQKDQAPFCPLSETMDSLKPRSQRSSRIAQKFSNSIMRKPFCRIARLLIGFTS